MACCVTIHFISPFGINYNTLMIDKDMPLKQSSNSEIRDIQDGTVIKDLIKPGKFLSVPEHLGLMLNTDGVQTFNALKHSMWPWFPISHRILEKYLVLAGAWFGPTDISLLIQPILDKIERIYMGPGLIAKTPDGIKKVKCVLLADLPVKAAVVNCVQFNGHNGCTYCLDKGAQIGMS